AGRLSSHSAGLSGRLRRRSPLTRASSGQYCSPTEQTASGELSAMHDTRDLNGRIALVTGADVGIGRATALALAMRGADVAVHFHSQPPRAAATVAAIEALGRRAIATGGDLTHATDVARVAEDVARRLGPIDILVNNAGGLLGRQPLVDMSEDFFHAVMNV